MSKLDFLERLKWAASILSGLYRVVMQMARLKSPKDLL
jgi:hypothetical protein